jgi:hypothetical protein
VAYGEFLAESSSELKAKKADTVEITEVCMNSVQIMSGLLLGDAIRHFWLFY